ncbi:MAG: 3'(2'),5'-bisphosphate nucleotidase CysQ [Flavobacteriales bacterium]|jgi:3'(2'), 5'-bisphosphate nucleotidase|nr:3'(2'),5'-bisphosphate nucleotidase CysQ [Flavobacteriales bacterium]MDG1440075.1 3'(2'),5'-bisphosphate nucleotidase CysQ [Flavobacteriales bacterium]
MKENDKLDKWLSVAKKAAIEAGLEILKVYHQKIDVEFKKDNSPLTIADKNANHIIEKYLLTTNIPILSEEGRHAPYQERKNWNLVWIVDPLDGTKEFIKKNGEFTVNIALVKNGIPIIGVIYVPVSKCLYFASYQGSFKELEGERLKLPLMRNNNIYKVVGSRSHISSETEKYYADLKKEKNEIEFVSLGSSIKICLVAEGVADVYPRFAPTMEWDTAAGHAIAKYANKKLIDLETEQEMVYNRSNLKNNWFIVK